MRRKSSARLGDGLRTGSMRGSPASWARKSSLAAKGMGGVEIDDPQEAESFERVGKDCSLLNGLEGVWVCGLDHGVALAKGRMDSKHFTSWCKQTGVIADQVVNQKLHNLDASYASKAFDVASAPRGDGALEFAEFTHALGLISFYKNPQHNGDHHAAITALLSDPLEKWLADYKTRNEHDGLLPGDDLLKPLDVDRLLYIYHTPFQRLFDKYRVAQFGGAGRPLPYAQAKILAEAVELAQFREFAKDFLIFPKLVSFAELSKVAQLACFGRVVVAPLKQTTASECSTLSDQKQTRKSSFKVLPGVVQDTSTLAPEEYMGHDTDNGLGIEYLNTEEMREVLLDKHMFIDAIMRLAQVVFTRTEVDRQRYPSIASRVEALLRLCEPSYVKIFGREMRDDCDWVLKGLPLLRNTAPDVACRPARGGCGGGYDISIEGSNFCTKRGAYVELTDLKDKTHPVVIKAHTTKSKKVIATAPEVTPHEVHVVVTHHAPQPSCSVSISRFAVCSVECSNDRHNFTMTDPSQCFTFEEVYPTWYLEDDVMTKLSKAFSYITSYKDRRNTRFLTLEKWKSFKNDYSIKETGFGSAEGGCPLFAEAARVQALPPLVTREGEVLLGATRTENCVDFKGFLHLVVKCLCQRTCEVTGKVVFDPLRPMAVMQQVAEKACVQESKRPEVLIDDILPEVARTRVLLSEMERRPRRTLDIYSGPVLVARLDSKPGTIAMLGTNASPPITHRSLSCVIYDGHNLPTVAECLVMSTSFTHAYSRLHATGYQFCPPCDAATRKPVGRCWSVHNTKTIIGAMWDYPGHFSNHHWQPTPFDAYSPHVSMFIAQEHTEVDFIVCFMQFLKAVDVADMRRLLAQRGYTLRTVLYKRIESKQSIER